MKPIIILPPQAVSEKDIELLRENGLCVVVAKEPSLVQFVDPIPSVSSRTQIEDAAIRLSRKILNPGFWTSDGTREQMTRAYVDLLFEGTPLSTKPTKAEREQEIFDSAKLDELRRLAREEAKKERELAKAKKATPVV